jgi:hypothetical protein
LFLGGAQRLFLGSVSRLFLGGAAVHRCDNRPFSKSALATEVRDKDGTGKLQPQQGRQIIAQHVSAG